MGRLNRIKEKLKRLHQEDVEASQLNPEKKNRHYSQQPDHAKRSVANDPRKKSRLRGNH